MDISERKIPVIRELPKQMADKIAAGEVVDRPLSIVKELVENSIDAGSSSIVVEIKNGGKSYIRVTDDGCGIPSDQTELAFKRHATSKLQTVKDLDAIETLGFRGEALASIAAVSRVELITRTSQENMGVCMQVEGGITASVSATGCPQGTTIIVRDLFFNTPARLKFLKKDNTESGLIIDFISKLALAYTSIRIRLINNGSTLFSTQGKGDMTGTIATIYDSALVKKLIHFNEEMEGGIRAEGYISSPDETRASRKNQIFFVNGRYIHSKILEKSISDGYREKMFEGRFPVVFLFITLPPDKVDVNIHPSKREIRFDNENLVREFITASVKKALKVPGAVPDFTFKRDKSAISSGSSAFRAPASDFPKQKQEQLDIRKILQQKRAEEEAVSYAGSQKSAGKLNPSVNSGEKSASGRQPAEEISDSNADALFDLQIESPESRPFDVASIRPIGTLFASYILGCDDNCFYMIDQHAAHERVFYEQLSREFYSQENTSQMMAIPINITVSHSVKEREKDWMRFLESIGFVIEEFGPKSYAVKAIPGYMSDTEARLFLNDFTDGLDEPGVFRDKRRLDRIITRSCKSAVKANDRLDPAEVSYLIKSLARCENPFSCPHGRPTIIRMKKSEIEALFKR